MLIKLQIIRNDGVLMYEHTSDATAEAQLAFTQTPILCEDTETLLTSMTITPRCERRSRVDTVVAFPGEKFTPKDYGIDDTIKLAVRPEAECHAEATRFLQKWGAWWQVKHAYRGGAAWLLRSIQNQPREQAKTKIYDSFVMTKNTDPYYAVIGVVKFPDPFTYKLAEAKLRIETQ